MTRREPSVSHHRDLIRRLRNSRYAAGYLTACLAEGDDVFLLGLRHVAEAQGGLRKLASRTRLNREHLFRMLASTGNPEFQSLRRITGKLGLEWALRPAASRRAA